MTRSGQINYDHVHLAAACWKQRCCQPGHWFGGVVSILSFLGGKRSSKTVDLFLLCQLATTTISGSRLVIAENSEHKHTMLFSIESANKYEKWEKIFKHLLAQLPVNLPQFWSLRWLKEYQLDPNCLVTSNLPVCSSVLGFSKHQPASGVLLLLF